MLQLQPVFHITVILLKLVVAVLLIMLNGFLTMVQKNYKLQLGGNILNANNTYGSLSDVKLKENIVDANSQWDDIKGLKIRNFNFKQKIK